MSTHPGMEKAMNASDRRIASEFLSNWLPFLSRGLCRQCTQTLADSVRSLAAETDCDQELVDGEEENINVSARNVAEWDGCYDSHDNCETHSLGSWGDGADMNDTVDTSSLGSWKDGASGWSEPIPEASSSEKAGSVTTVEHPRVKMSWADMAHEDELELAEENNANKLLVNRNSSIREVTKVEKGRQVTELSREQREHIRFNNVRRKKDFICLERVNGKIVNILDGLELHTGVFSAAEQKRIVDFVYELQEMGKNGELKERTFTAPQKWMKGKGRVTIQFGCCYNYATDKSGNPPGILQAEIVDPIPHLFRVIIRRLVKWHVLPPSCVPDSCIVNIYEEGDCIPPHIDHHDFVRPFCTVSFLSECNIVFGTNLKVIAPGEFSGAIAIPLPVGSVLVLNGNGADVAKHCVPAVPSKRISITFRKMDEYKLPNEYGPEPDLQGIQPLSYESDRSKNKNNNNSKPKLTVNNQAARRGDNSDRARRSAEKGSEPRYSGRGRQRLSKPSW